MRGALVPSELVSRRNALIYSRSLHALREPGITLFANHLPTICSLPLAKCEGFA